MDRSFDAQYGARLTAKELQNLQKDMFGWSASMKQKNARKAPAAEAARPPPHAAGAGQSSGTAQQQREPAGAAATKHPAAHTYEHYRSKWDRFDVDAALAEAAGEAGRRAERSNGAPASSGGGGSGGSRGAPSAGQAGRIPEARVTVPVGPSPPGAVPQPAVSQGGGAPAARSAPKSAGDWKDVGNEHFKAGRYQEAVDCYTSSLAVQPSCVAAANRALARIKLGQPAAAEEDCSLGLALDPAYVKAYQRRATARRELGNLLGAVEDCEAALRLEPGNRQAAAERAAHVAALLRQRGLQAPSRRVPLAVRSKPLAATRATAGALRAADLVLDPGVQLAANGAAAAESSGEEIIRAASTQPAPAAQPAAAAPAVARIQVVEEADGEESVPPLEGATGPSVQGAGPAGQQQQTAEEDGARGLGSAAGAQPAAPSSPQSTQADGGPGDGQLGGLAWFRQGSIPAVGTPPATELAPPDSEPPSARSAAVLPASRPGPAMAAEAAPFKMPRTGLEFEKAWRGFKGDQQQQGWYLLQLPPAQLPALLKQALSPSLLAAAAAALLQQAARQDPAAAVALLEGLTGVARFDINLLSVPPGQKRALSAAWDAAAAQLDAALAGRLASVRAKYKL